MRGNILREDIRSGIQNNKLLKERREHLANRAIDVFLQNGYDATRTKEIAEAIGMSEGSLYRYIGSKEDILHLICHYFGVGADAVRHRLANRGNLNVTETLCESIAEYFKSQDTSRNSVLFFNREIHKLSREDRRVMMKSQADLIDYFENILTDGIKNGEFQLHDTKLLAHNILLLGHDWPLRQWYLSQYYTLEEYTREQITMIMRILKPVAGGLAKEEIP